VPPLDEDPVEGVTWDDAREYCIWAHLRLPTEVEWEYAAGYDTKLGRVRKYAWGDAEPSTLDQRVGNLADVAYERRWTKLRDVTSFYEPIQRVPGMDPAVLPGKPIFNGYDDGYAGPAPVGSFPAGASPTGALDMTGNVFEWSSTRLDDRRSNVAFVIRGGAFGSPPNVSRVSFRGHAEHDQRAWGLGFRVARDAR
jgi:iron(II)-dependent oxidoreductase